MKVRASVKRICENCKLVRRHGQVCWSSAATRATSSGRAEEIERPCPVFRALTFRRQADAHLAALHLRHRADDGAAAVREGQHRPAAQGQGADRRRDRPHRRSSSTASTLVEGPLRRADPAEHRPAEGHQLLPRRAAPHEPAGPRPADQDQRPHPQGAAQDGRRQEGRQGNARLVSCPWSAGRGSIAERRPASSLSPLTTDH